MREADTLKAVAWYSLPQSSEYTVPLAGTDGLHWSWVSAFGNHEVVRIETDLPSPRPADDDAEGGEV